MKARPGRPKGSGYKRPKKLQITTYIDIDVAQKLRREKCMADVINTALKKHYGLDKIDRIVAKMEAEECSSSTKSG